MASLTIAQAIIESGWGKSSIGNNIFGIKVGTKWKGKKQLVNTREFVNGEWINIKAWFRDYDSIEDCIEDRNKFLQYPRYRKVLASKNHKEACIEIYKAGYATDPNYTKLLTDIIEQNKLYLIDEESKKSEVVGLILRRGNKDSNVVALQDKLNRIGLNVGATDGNYGHATEKQVKELQNIFNLGIDGIAGKNTLDILDKLDKVKHFKLDEFRCKHCKALKLDINLLLKLEELRKLTGALIINSGYRCPIHNRSKEVGSNNYSQHIKGTAADLRGVNMSPSQVHAHADKVFSNGGLGKYNTFTHVDVRNGRSRWNG